MESWSREHGGGVRSGLCSRPARLAFSEPGRASGRNLEGRAVRQRTGLGRRELNKLHTREALLNAARDAFVENGTFTTIDEIADRALVSRATFFNYFPSKDELLGALYDELIVRLEEVVEELLASDLTTGQRIARLFLDFAERASGPSKFLLAFTAELDRAATIEQVGERGEHLRGLIARILRAGQDVGDLRDDHSVEFLAQMVAGMYLAAMQHGWVTQDGGLVKEFEAAGRFAAEAIAPR